MPKRRRRGQPKGPTLQKKVKCSADVEVATLDNPSNTLEVVPVSVEEQEAGTHTVAKRREGGQPRGSTLQKKIGSADVEVAVLDNPRTALEVDPVLLEEQEMVMPKKRGRGRPKRSSAQNCQESVSRNVSSHINASAMVEVVHEGEELENAVNRPMQRGQGRPKGSLNQKNHPLNADINVGHKRNVRGRKRELILEMKRKQSADGKLDVTIHPTKLVPVGPGRNDFIADLSIIVRENARFNVNMWRKVPQDTRDTIVEKVLNNWRLQDTALVRKAILDKAGRLYQNWRNRLHYYYLTFKTKEEALNHVPDEVNDSDWKFLVDYFSSPSFEIISTKNKVNQTKQRINHTSGRKSFHAVSYDARDPETGKEPDLQTLWQMTHVRVNGEWINEASKEVNDKVAEQINERRCQNGIETIESEIVSTAFKTVVGRKSIMQSFAGGQDSPESSNFIRVQQLQAELDAQKIETMNAKKECNDMRAKLEQERQKREEVEAQLLDRQKDLQEIKSQVQTAIQSVLPQYCLLTTEAETSLKHKRKIEELEAQLHEAEDVITDIRSELVRYRRN